MASDIKIRTLVEVLWDLRGREAVKRLSERRGVGGRSRDAMCEALARSYRGNHEEFVADLRKADLEALLTDPPEVDGQTYYLPSARSYSRSDLDEIALELFCGDGVPRQLEMVDEEDEEDEEDDEYEEDDEHDEDEEDRHDPRSEEYRRSFLEDFAAQSAPHQPYPYQRDAINAIVPRLVRGARPLLHVATGGGKTLIANEIVAQVRRSNRRVLWMTKDWRLLYQAARDRSRRHGGLAGLTRLGGDGTVLHPLAEGNGPLCYTTIHTLSRRLPQGVLDGFDLVVWDECHWGEHSKFGRAISKELKRRGIPLLGLTATPRPPAASAFEVAFAKSFWELVRDGYLARPLIEEPVQTGIRWRPRRSGDQLDFDNSSLKELAKNERRNRLIVDHYVTNASRYGQTILFACNKEHANRLAGMLGARGVAARAIHSGNADRENQAHLDAFRTHRATVATNVAMLTHGLDVPSVRTVLLARPTLSDILYSQMIGRASRLDLRSQKDTFNVVEFTDNLKRFGEDLRTAKKFFEGAGPVVSSAATSTRAARPTDHDARQREHRYDPAGAPTWIPDDPSVPEAMRGLWYRQGQTFGFEVEVTQRGIDPYVMKDSRRWHAVAEALRAGLEARIPGRVAQEVFPEYQGVGGRKDTSLWNIEFDGSVGWEVSSRVLRDEAGYREVVEAMAALESVVAQHDLRLDHRTGLHLHLAWTYSRPSELRRFIQLVRKFEPGLAALVGPSRVAEYDGRNYQLGSPNGYCQPISAVIPGRDLAHVDGQLLEAIRERLAPGGDTRYTTANLTPLLFPRGVGTVEIRMHSGTVEAPKMLLWLSLWQQILWAAGTQSDIPSVPDRESLAPDEDVVMLAYKYLPEAGQQQQQAFLQKLSRRRQEVVGLWEAHPDLAPWLHYADSWKY